MTNLTANTDPSRFDSEAFAEVEAQVMRHVLGFTTIDSAQRERWLAEERPRDILDAVRGTARQMMGVPAYPADKGFNRLVQISLIEQLPAAAVEAIATFLTAFEAEGDTLVEDYRNTLRTLHNLSEIPENLREAVQAASTLHGFQGQLVYEWLTTAHYLILAVQATLKDDARYAREKFTAARTHLGWSEVLAQRYRPDVFSVHKAASGKVRDGCPDTDG